jgi:hypothetical protein
VLQRSSNRDTDPPAVPGKLPLNPGHPERVCWGCDHFCAADDLRCGNGTVRTQHPVEIFGRDWLEWGLEVEAPDESLLLQRTRPSPKPEE